MEIRVVTAIYFAAGTGDFPKELITGEVATATGKQAPKTRHTFTSLGIGRGFTAKKVKRGMEIIFTTEAMMSFKSPKSSLKLVSPSCIPMTSMERGVVAEPIISTPSKIIEGSFRPAKSMKMPTKDEIVPMWERELITFLKENFSL